MRTSLKFSSLIVVLVLLTGALGDQSKKQSPQIPGWFSRLDRDGNGTLESKEAGRFLAEMDGDRDGKVTLAEAVAWRKTRSREAARAGVRKQRGQTVAAREFITREKTGQGLWVVSIGHSCVIPAIGPCITVSRSAGFKNHTHLMQFGGGASGAAEAQWNRPDDRQEAKPALRCGKIDVMTFGHLVTADGKSRGCDAEDYQRWIELALKHNPRITFFIQDLWPWLPGKERTVDFEAFDLKDYEAAMAVSSQSVAAVVEKLNQKYPDRVRVLPVGVAMTELVRRVTKDQLPGVDAVLVPANEKRDRIGLYRDKIHPTALVASLEGYIYYACLYGKNPEKLKAGIYRDKKLDQILREVAWKTVTEHPLSGVEEASQASNRD